jgi:hypothetical protein
MFGSMYPTDLIHEKIEISRIQISKETPVQTLNYYYYY